MSAILLPQHEAIISHISHKWIDDYSMIGSDGEITHEVCSRCGTLRGDQYNRGTYGYSYSTDGGKSWTQSIEEPSCIGNSLNVAGQHIRQGLGSTQLRE